MTAPATTWGVVSTIRATTREILDFCAHHLDIGAHRIYVYLDDADQTSFDILRAHPKLHPILCDAAYWAETRGKRPEKHQNRQSFNATHAYRQHAAVDWLAHIDVDEFIWPHGALTLGETLALLPGDCQTARLRPIESLAPHPSTAGDSAVTYFKSCSVKMAKRRRETLDIYPDFGKHLNGGFLSHVQGKTFFRTAIDGFQIRIHNVFLDGEINPNMEVLTSVDLCHMHAHSWSQWYAAYRYRLEKGSYRAELSGGNSANSGRLTPHQLFCAIEDHDGTAGLRAFFETVCTASPDLRKKLMQYGLLRSLPLDLDRKRQRHFPDFTLSSKTGFQA